MSEHRSFVPSDFSLRDIPFLIVCLALPSAICLLFALAFDVLPPFLGGFLCGLLVGGLGAIYLLSSLLSDAKGSDIGKEVDIESLPELSTNVKQQCDNPSCQYPSRLFAEAVKTYCVETGASLTQGTEVLRAYLANRS